MEQREKLIELLRLCVHSDSADPPDVDEFALGLDADHLIANGVVVLPCKVGEIVYEVRNNTDACFDCPCYSDFYGLDVMCTRDGEDVVDYPNLSEEPVCKKHYYEVLEYVIKDEKRSWNIRDKVGKTVFLTREEAKKALAKRKGGDE